MPQNLTQGPGVGPTRRQVLRGAAAVALGPGLSASAGPWFHARRRPRLRVIGTHVTLRAALRERASAELGIDLVFEPGGSAAVLQRASTRPDSFDVYEQWSNSLNVLWDAGAIQGIDSDRIEAWDEINPLTKTGRLTPDARIGRGDAPYKLLYVQPDGSVGSDPTDRVSFLPYVHNVDSFGYNTDTVPEGEPYETESWAWLLDPRWRGRVALVNEPTIGIFDAALAAQAAGLMEFADIGAMTRSEIDRLFEILIELKQAGHYCGLWNSVPQSVDFFERGRAVIASMFSPGVATLNSKGYPVHYAAPKEGYRAWHGVMCLSSLVSPEAEEAAYRFMNWWLDGWAGAFIARQGYYISVPHRAAEHMTREEWDYWYAGRPAATDLPGTDGEVAVRAGSVRRGGSYENRFANVAVWNTVMNTYEYSMLRWYEFLTS